MAQCVNQNITSWITIDRGILSKVPCSTPGSSCFSLVFIKKLINFKSKHKKKMLLFVLYCLEPLTCTSL